MDFGIDSLYHRDGKGCGLAGACLGLSNHIFSIQKNRYRLFLNGRHDLESHFPHCL